MLPSGVYNRAEVWYGGTNTNDERIIMKRCPHCSFKSQVAEEMYDHLVADERYPAEDASVVAYSDRFQR